MRPARWRARDCSGCPTCTKVLTVHDPLRVYRGRLAKHWGALLADDGFAAALEVFALTQRGGR